MPFRSHEHVRREPGWSLTVTLYIPYVEASFGAGDSMMCIEPKSIRHGFRPPAAVAEHEEERQSSNASGDLWNLLLKS